MPWAASPAFLGGRLTFFKTISANVQDLNLWDDCGNPAVPSDVFVTVDSGVFVDSMTIGDWPASSVINITNNGTFRGRGGNGGMGGSGESLNDNPAFTCSSPGSTGDAGQVGGWAIRNNTNLEVNIDTDNGWIWAGAGGGGGGGSGSSSGGYGGGGGGGGRGWNVSAGGGGGAGTSGTADAGTAGGPSAGGTGGDGMLSTNEFGGDGGNGGTNWGSSGSNGVSGATPDQGPGVRNCSGGAGGAAGSTVFVTSGTPVNNVGAKSVATLQGESRLLGSVSGWAP
jgi:hypothetical protein